MKYFCLLIVLALTACQQAHTVDKNAAAHTFTVQKTRDDTKLYFKGRLQPLSLVNISSPENGIITTMHFTFGQKIQAHQLLLTIKSAELSKQYQENLTTYLKNKEAYTTAKQKFSGTQRLAKDGIISKIEFRNSQVQLNDSYLSYMQAKKKLRQLLIELNIDPDKIFNLDISKRQSINNSLNKNPDIIAIYAPVSGLALHPLNSNDDDNTTSNKSTNIVIGSSVKKNHTLMSIGNINGLKINVDVDEINILAIKKDQPVIITGVAFPGIVLHGYVANISDQANINMGNSMPTFPITIIVPKLTPSQQQLIHIGMSANAMITVNHGNNFIVPLNAVFQHNGKRMVTIVNKKTGKLHNVIVQTGHTTATKVVLTHGVKPGDTLVIGH